MAESITIPLSAAVTVIEGTGNRSVKTAISLPDLVRQTNSFSKKYRGGCSPRLLDSNPRALFLHYNVKCNKDDSDPAGHDVRVQFDVTKVQESQKAKDLDVQVQCSCVAPGTMIRMADGTEKPIEQVQTGDRVITHKGRARRVTAVMSRPAKDGERAWEVKGEGYRDPLVLSDEHPLAVIRGNEVCACGCGIRLKHMYASNTKSGQARKPWSHCFSPGHGSRAKVLDYSEGHAGWVPPPDLIEQELLYFPRFAWSGTKKVDPDFAALVGYYLAEGSLTSHAVKRASACTSQIVSMDGQQRCVYDVQFALNADERKTLAHDIETKVKRVFGKEVPVIIRPTSTNGIQVEVKHSKFAAEMYRLAGRGSLTKKLSAEILSWDKDAMFALVSAYALGDGHTSEREQNISSASRDLIMQVSAFLFSIGVWHGFTWEDRPEIGSRIYRLVWDYRKHPQLFERMKCLLPEREVAVLIRKNNRVWGDGYRRVLQSRKPVVAPSIFYDLEVNEDHSFIANGIVVHNCPAFIWWGAQWNLHQRDGLLGPARPELQAPKERLDLRGNYVICKHIHAVFERILPSVQHNIVNILRKREVDRRKLELERKPEDLQKQKEREEKKKKIDELRSTKNKKIKDKLLDALRNEEEARMLHEKDLEDQAPGDGSGAVERDEPATEPHEETPKKREPELSKLPKHYQPEEQETEDIQDLTDQEEEKIEKLHEEHKPHLHKGLPYETGNGKKSSKHASADEPGLLWRAPGDKHHDYQPSWDYEPRENSDPELAKLAVNAAQRIYQRTKQPFELWDVDMTEYGAVAMYINGTCGFPVVLIDLEAHRGYEDQFGKSIDHELKHATQDSEGREFDEDEAEED